MKSCSVEHCIRKHASKGFCGLHYSKYKRWGDPLGGLKPPRIRFWDNVDKSKECWTWLLSTESNKGYGEFRINGIKRGAHVWAFEMLFGPIPRGLHLDHLCRNRACVNPFHLEPVTCAENIMRGESFSAKNARKTHCNNGHALMLLENRPSRSKRKHRECPVCIKSYEQKYYMERTKNDLS